MSVKECEVWGLSLGSSKVAGCDGFSVRTFLYFDCPVPSTYPGQHPVGTVFEVNHNMFLMYKPRMRGLLSLVPLLFEL